MAHSTTEEYLNRDNIDEYFQLLAEEIKESGIGEHRILVVGGAAMALKYHDGRSTVDIDICIREQHDLYKCCQKVAAVQHLPEDWINADVMHSDSFSYGLFRDATLYRTYEGILNIYVASDMDLYCMKLVSFRLKDIQDMDVLADSLRAAGMKRKDVEENFLRLYGDMYFMKNDERKEQLLGMQFMEK